MIRIIGLLTLVGIISSGCTHNAHNAASNNGDPIEPANRVFFNINETLDKRLVKPVARKYADITPAPVRTRVTYFFENLGYLNTVLNSLLQGKWDQGIQDSLRFLYNSSIGIGGLFDVATAWGLPKRKEDLGQTLATWGVAQGAYLNLPISGPNTLRNIPNFATKTLLSPLTYTTSSVILFPASALNLINMRANLLMASDMRDDAALDPYIFTREAYLQQRKSLIYDGKLPEEEYDALFFDALDSDQ